ncbi:MAG: cation:dicarboxylase symporter family transporter [Thermincola sp.]|nr:cation:dicarboxylase symporter family transporter [Thermincola sp.]
MINKAIKVNSIRDWTDSIKKPWAIALGTAAGIFIGIYNKGLAMRLEPFGDLYLSFLKMSVIPIMITAIVASFGGLLSSQETRKYLKRIIAVFLIGLLLSGVVGMIVALAGNPGQGLKPEARETLGTVLMNAEKISGAGQQSVSIGFSGFVRDLVPTNIFAALYEGKTLQILFFSIVFGLTIGIIPKQNSEQILELTNSTFKAFEKAIGLAMYGLPFGLLGIMAGQVARTGTDILLALAKLILLIHLAALILIFLGGFIISVRSGISLFQSFKNLREPIIIAFGTRNSFATMPSVFSVVRDSFHLPQNAINLIVPLSIVICRFSMVLVFTIGTVFIVQLYGVPLSIGNIIFAVFAAVLAALAGAGAPGMASLSMIAIILTPLGLPTDAAVIMLLAAFSIIDPILTIVNILLTCTAAMVITGHPLSQTVISGTPVKEVL